MDFLWVHIAVCNSPTPTAELTVICMSVSRHAWTWAWTPSFDMD